VDTETERVIQEAMQKIGIGRTMVVIAHRLSTIRNASRIIVIHKGRLKEEGTHDELIELGGIYHHLYNLQYI
jgi:ABC-type multidrug transport system fused ATPase/permease subunit